jgi:DNA replication factor GINS
MNLDELQSVQARERQSSDLQHLRSSFYKEVGEYIERLTEKRARVVEEADDPFSSPEARQLTDDIETAEQTVEAIYERRVGKVVKKASIAAADMPVEDEGLTREERALFEDLVDRIEENRETVLSVLDGDAPSVSCSIDETVNPLEENGGPGSPETSAETTTDPESETRTPPEEGSIGPGGDATPTPGGAGAPGQNAADAGGTDADDTGGISAAETERVDAADLMGGDSSGADTEAPPESSGVAGPKSNVPASNAGADATERETERQTERQEREVPGIPRTTVRITADIGEVVGADNRDYDLGTEDVVTLPEPNAEMLLEKNAAERLGEDPPNA